MGRVGVLVGDRNAEVRRAACQALHLVYTRMDGPTLLTHVAHASPPEQVSHHQFSSVRGMVHVFNVRHLSV